MNTIEKIAQSIVNLIEQLLINIKKLFNRDISCKSDIFNFINNFLKLNKEYFYNNYKYKDIYNYLEKLEECYNAYQDILNEQIEYKKADIILKTYYQKDRIFDYLRKVDDFINEINDMSSTEAAVIRGYNNYVYFIEKDFKLMNEKLNEIESQSSEQNSDKIEEKVCSFIRNEGGDLIIKELPNTYNDLRELNKLIKQKNNIEKNVFNEKINKYISNINATFNKLSNIAEDDLNELKKLKENLEKRKNNIEDRIKKGKELYGKLNNVFSEDWFYKLNPENEYIKKVKDKDEIKEIYVSAMKTVEEGLGNYFSK